MSALIWGSSFIVMKNAVDFISPFTLLCIRFVLSTIFISILFFNKIKNICQYILFPNLLYIFLMKNIVISGSMQFL